ncbi:MAG: EI24 domain-containing protein [Erythrobacter sp.]|uniref:EI24 domain-containing protein n=1 Tax=Erythrobacter sp. TaxID=1042 RepID=UPI00261CBB68|nr:EI24 domain-containing protein [Erythrobacter sp.]MDJ0978531.1 EI24 domain-containing protein [Erythrobacter sp.]
MTTVLAALAKAVGQLSDPAIVRVLVKTALITALLFAGLVWSLYRGLIWIGTEMNWSGEGWIEAITAAVLALVAGWLLFRTVALAVLQLFADEIVAAVEARHYPIAATHAKPLPLHQDIGNALRGMARALVFNALAIPVAAVLFVTGIGPAAVFLIVNAVLLGRELTDMAWLRHCEGDTRGNPVSGLDRLTLGGAIAGLMLVPFVNLLAPVIGAAAGTHLTQGALSRAADKEANHA